MARKIPISEIFFSLQGEGLSTGKPCMFVRVAGCNLKCGFAGESTWQCDTWEVMYNVKASYTPSELAEEVLSKYPRNHKGPKKIVITGGEPLLYASELKEFIIQVSGKESSIVTYEVETNGTLDQKLQELTDELGEYRVRFNISPKLSNSGMNPSERINPEFFDIVSEYVEGGGDVFFKFVVSREQDYEELKETYFPLLEGYLGPDWRSYVSLMPAMISKDDMEAKRYVWDLCVRTGFSMSPRYHIEVWDNKKGV